MKRVFVILLTLAMLLSVCGVSAAGLSKIGSRSEEVRAVQQALKEKGYYNYAVDGIFGTRTRSAVISFQKDNGLDPDGIAGEKTLKALGVYSGSDSYGGYSSSDYDLLARIISAEARGES